MGNHEAARGILRMQAFYVVVLVEYLFMRFQQVNLCKKIRYTHTLLFRDGFDIVYPNSIPKEDGCECILVILRNDMFIYQTQVVAWDPCIADKDQIYIRLCFQSG